MSESYGVSESCSVSEFHSVSESLISDKVCPLCSLRAAVAVMRLIKFSLLSYSPSFL